MINIRRSTNPVHPLHKPRIAHSLYIILHSCEVHNQKNYTKQTKICKENSLELFSIRFCRIFVSNICALKFEIIVKQFCATLFHQLKAVKWHLVQFVVRNSKSKFSEMFNNYPYSICNQFCTQHISTYFKLMPIGTCMNNMNIVNFDSKQSVLCQVS